MDEEHRLIAHYASCLAGNTTSPGCESTDSNQSFDPHKTKRNLIVALERKNKEITKQINKIKEQQEKSEGGRVNPALVSELKALRSHRTQLESHLISLQDSRKSLLGQLEGLMRLLKSLRSPPSSTGATLGSVNNLQTANGSGPRSAPPTPSHTNHYSSLDSIPSESLGSSGLSSLRSSCFGSLGHQGSLSHNTGSLGHAQGSFGHGQHQRSSNEDPNEDGSPDSEGEKLRNDLLLAADSVTNAMSSLVRELNSDSDSNLFKWSGGGGTIGSNGTHGTRHETPVPKREVPNVQRRSQRSASCGGVRIPPARDSWSEPPAGLLKR